MSTVRQIIKHLIGGAAFILAGFAILLYSLIAVMSLKVYRLWFDGEGYIGGSLYTHIYVLFADTFITPGMFPIVLTFCFLLAKKTENLRGLGLILVILSAMFHYYIVALAAHVTLHVLYIEPILSVAVLFWFYKYQP
jgi:hypothetical protein